MMIRTNVTACMALFVLLCLPATALAEPADEASAAPASLLEFQAQRLRGGTESLDLYRGQVLLVVNTASLCGHTPQFEGLQALYERYASQGFSILGFPSNDFGGQEPGNDREIGAFCKANYGVAFPMFSKVRVKGPDAHPVYAYLTSLPAPIGGEVEWNFQKYLVDRDGNVVARYASGVKPRDPALVAEVERLLAESRPEPPTAALAP